MKIVGDLEVDIEEEGEELDAQEVGPAMCQLLADGGAGSSGVVPGVSRRPHGVIPSLLGFSEEETQKLLGLKDTDVLVPYLGEGDQKRVPTEEGEGSARQARERPRRGRRKLQTVGAGRWEERRASRRRQKFGVGGRVVRTLNTINRDPHNRPLQMVCRSADLSVVGAPRPISAIPPVPKSFHRRMYDESTEGFSKTGRYHPEDARLKNIGTWEAIYEELRLYRIAPPWWTGTQSEWYTSSDESSSDTSGIVTG